MSNDIPLISSPDNAAQVVPPHRSSPRLEEPTAPDRARRANHHRLMLFGSGLIIVLALLLQIRPDHRIQLRWGPEMPLPEVCASKVYLGIECPGCGLTRSFIALSRGDLWQAWYLNRFSWLLAVAVLAQFPYRLWALWHLEWPKGPQATWPNWCGRTLVAILVANWILKMVGV